MLPLKKITSNKIKGGPAIDEPQAKLWSTFGDKFNWESVEFSDGM